MQSAFGGGSSFGQSQPRQNAVVGSKGSSECLSCAQKKVNQDASQNGGNKTSASSVDLTAVGDQSQKSSENNKLFAKIIENELYNVPMDCKLDCMQDMLEALKKYSSKETE